MRLKILVTGGAGYIGSHTCKALATAGYAPVVLDDLSAGHDWAVGWGPLIAGDIDDRALVMNTLRRFNVEGTIHFATHRYVGESVQHPRKYFDNNVSKSLTLLDALLDVGVDKVVFSSLRRARLMVSRVGYRSRRIMRRIRSVRMAHRN